ncbi:MAG: carboxypeptidase-like regulatory domain-containing protein, partial [Dehalococcoidales bacterium]|nr:carboxypeptidase-like regulatory domain-containing protein [Dehalococcoidales bacterium]
TIIAWDGRALGVEPYGFNHAYVVPAGEHIHQSVARRFDALIKVDSPINDFAYVNFVDNEAQVEGDANAQRVIFTAKIPINIGYSITGNVRNTTTSIEGVPMEAVAITLTGTTEGGQPVSKTTVTDHLGNYRFSGLLDGAYTVTPSLAGFLFTPASRGVPVAGANQAGEDFTGTQVEGEFVISGTVVSSRGAAVGIPQVMVNLNGDTSRVVMTDDEGHFYFVGMADGDYTVTPGNIHIGNAGLPDEDPDQPSNAAYAYSPPSMEVRVDEANEEIGFFRGRRLNPMDMGV